jgi:hypothetical protein
MKFVKVILRGLIALVRGWGIQRSISTVRLKRMAARNVLSDRRVVLAWRVEADRGDVVAFKFEPNVHFFKEGVAGDAN